jgi:hypothetical protein
VPQPKSDPEPPPEPPLEPPLEPPPQPEVTAAAPAAPSAKSPPPAKTDTKPTLPPGQDWWPIGTDIETLATTVAGKKCGAAVSALRDRIVKNKADARSWALLTTCYAKRKRWQNTIEAYEKVVEYGDAALIASVQAHADAAKAGLGAEAAPPPPTE